jgi:hypothetical protein
MKRIFAVMLLVVVVITTYGQEAHPVSTDKNVLKINTLSLFLGTGSIFYERKFTDNSSGMMGLGYLSFKFGDTKFSGLILTPEYRIYVKKDAIDGFYVAPYLRYQNYSLTVTSASAKGALNVFGGGAALGKQWITNGGFVMDLFFGAHYGSASLSVDTGTADSFDTKNFSGLKTRVGFALGFSF